ncbi:hypothetical protein DFJ58DRAFT_783226 [Suillus subalutaceus]|uniref:uncharacterized protein n=1 Tax=Suillus subalutaceus TaxID=48586 RepID=UPI001B866724|nr:uncharacterized protein DFJ58DRAFT_783226 [Suillus subalutaceus]KAG1857754.1 hypothetical protein DFJ58DRAFT_783226 [Suillus subalutaceus]
MTSQPYSDSKSVTDTPPSYTTTSTFELADSLQLRRFHFLQSKQTRNIVLTCIRDIVSAPDFTPSSVIPIVNACAAALFASEFFDLLQTPNIEGHTALYWAIVNERREAFSALSKFIHKISSTCSSDLRLACMVTNDQALFSQLNLGNVNSKDEPLRRSLGSSPDEVQVDSEDGLGKSQFIARLRIRKLEKRLLITEEVGIEFVAGGRIWLFRFYMTCDGRLESCRAQPSSAPNRHDSDRDSKWRTWLCILAFRAGFSVLRGVRYACTCWDARKISLEGR